MPNNTNELLKVVDNSLNKFLILGSATVHSVNLIYSLVNTIKFLEDMYESTSEEKYKEKIEQLEEKIQFIKCNCKDLCDC